AVQAAHQGRPGVWTWDDLAAAVDEANTMGQPRGPDGPTPDQAWAARHPITADERLAFLEAMAQQRLAERARQLPQSPEPVTDWEPLWSQRQQHSADRRVVRRTLEACGYLGYARRRIQLPIAGEKTARDS